MRSSSRLVELSAKAVAAWWPLNILRPMATPIQPVVQVPRKRCVAGIDGVQRGLCRVERFRDKLPRCLSVDVVFGRLQRYIRTSRMACMARMSRMSRMARVARVSRVSRMP
eukprot:4169955-Prymnesium_polylepis.1